MRNLVIAAALAAALATALAASCSDAGTGPTATSQTAAAGAAAASDGASESVAFATRLDATLCMAVLGDDGVPGAAVGLAPCAGAAPTFTWTPDGELRYGALCVDAAGGAGANSDPIVLWTCSGAPHQRWAGTPDGQIRGVNGGCLDVPAGVAARGTGLIIFACHGGPNQLWDRLPARGGAPDGVAIYPGQSLQAAVDANPPGTVFVIKAGTHRNQSVVPKSRDVFYGESGAVLDGGGTTRYAFWTGAAAPYPSDVRIHGLSITGYAPPAQFGPVRAGGHSAAENSRGWLVDSCDVGHNATGGIRVGHGTRVVANKVHHNLQIGVMGIGDSVLVEGNEIAYNNYRNTYDAGWEAGGTKFVATRALVVRDNHVHHNVGAGLWTDTDNIGALVEGNRVEDNAGSGIFHEISYAAVIRRNVVRRNGFPQGAWVDGGGITVAASPDVEIYENTVADNYNGITALQQARGDGRYGPLRVRNLWVHDNVVDMPTGLTGIGQDIGSTEVFTGWGNRFERNTYRHPGNNRPFAWMNARRTAAEWRGFGNDVAGRFEP